VPERKRTAISTKAREALDLCCRVVSFGGGRFELREGKGIRCHAHGSLYNPAMPLEFGRVWSQTRLCEPYRMAAWIEPLAGAPLVS
jgi:hypothetical protein